MKKLFAGISMVLVLGLVANFALADETVPFPYWQHGWAIMSFWSVSNMASSPTETAATATVTINLYDATADGALFASTTGTIEPGKAWMIGSADAWWGEESLGNGYGFGTYAIQATTDTIYLWGAVFANLGTSQPGYTVILPKNPYGMAGM